jgi:hypothetical protein
MFDANTARIVCAVLCILVLGLIVLRRKKEDSGTDLVGYVLMSMFIVLAICASAPGVATLIASIFAKLMKVAIGRSVLAGIVFAGFVYFVIKAAVGCMVSGGNPHRR